MRNTMAVQFFFLAKNITIKDRTRLKSFIPKIFKRHKLKLESLNYIFCSDEDLLKINKEYLQHDFYTDIITFGFSLKNKPITGEIYISIDRVKENSNVMGVSIKEELHRVVFHGVLHLCGYKDKKASDIKRMRKAEDALLSEYLKG